MKVWLRKYWGLSYDREEVEVTLIQPSSPALLPAREKGVSFLFPAGRGPW